MYDLQSFFRRKKRLNGSSQPGTQPQTPKPTISVSNSVSASMTSAAEIEANLQTIKSRQVWRDAKGTTGDIPANLEAGGMVSKDTVAVPTLNSGGVRSMISLSAATAQNEPIRPKGTRPAIPRESFFVDDNDESAEGGSRVRSSTMRSGHASANQVLTSPNFEIRPHRAVAVPPISKGSALRREYHDDPLIQSPALAMPTEVDTSAQIVGTPGIVLVI